MAITVLNCFDHEGLCLLQNCFKCSSLLHGWIRVRECACVVCVHVWHVCDGNALFQKGAFDLFAVCVVLVTLVFHFSAMGQAT